MVKSKIRQSGKNTISRGDSWKPRSSSWNTTDEYEIELRKFRAANENMRVSKLYDNGTFFTDYVVTKGEGDYPAEYIVEIRSRDRRINYCTCPDFQKNFLSTCKHIERVLLQQKSRVRTNPFIEIFINFAGDRNICIYVPDNINEAAKNFIEKYFDSSGELQKPVENTVHVLLRDYENAEQEVKSSIRISRAVYDWEEQIRYKEHNRKIKEKYAAELRQSAGEAEFLRYPLYDYQIDGMLHLAFNERSMLADEMGLGKTVQAVAAACVLHKLHAISRVLVVCPASLKTEWEEQIRKFTNLSVTLLFGLRNERLRIYRECQSFFLITNYEQIIRDFEEINSLYQPDLVILDEAQRIKNWKTKTAQRIKRLNSRFAFVLTGTPLENRIDELYSLTEFIDPTLFGSLFRFNRMFHKFDESGKITGLKNLRVLHEMIRPIMLRRRKDEIEEQLPDRIDNNYFVDMTKEQRIRYEEYENYVARILALAGKRPLKPEEFERLQQFLACMRMLCDSVYILDKKYREAPKIQELVRVLNDIWEEDKEKKVIIFSEWVSMLELIRNELEVSGIEYALHVGYIPQKERRTEINKFKNSTECKVFLSSDSGGLGLNLQVASVVINMDLPWNPAKLEQRIARSWRKYQKNTVNVINFISKDTIEHKMLGTLSYKKGLADGVLDGKGDIDELEQENAKRIFIERLSELMGTKIFSTGNKKSLTSSSTPQVSPKEKFVQEIKLDAGKSAKFCNIVKDKEDSDNIQGVFAVSNNIENAKKYINAIVDKTKAPVKKDDIIVIDENTYFLLQKLAAKGILNINYDQLEEVFKAEKFTPEQESVKQKRLKMAKDIIHNAERKLQAGSLLYKSGFKEEAIAPLKEALSITGKTLAVLAMDDVPDSPPVNFNAKHIELIKKNLDIPDDMLLLLTTYLTGEIQNIDKIFPLTEKIFDITSTFINELALR